MAKITRRKFLKITATSLSLSLIPSTLLANSLEKTTWSGVALGAKGSMTLFHKDSLYAKETLEICIKELRRLEGIFSLVDNDSFICLLNKNGSIENPPKELVEVLRFAEDISRTTDGAFDVTVQPLWTAHANFFKKGSDADTKRFKKEIQKAQKLVSYKKLIIDEKEIYFKSKGMSITLNGIAQGYITDKITNILKQKGFENVLVDLGEINSIGGYNETRDWNIATPYLKDIKYITLNGNAVASSGGYGTKFDENYHHLFNPKTGTSANSLTSTTVVAPNAMLADALSTAVFVMPLEKSEKLKQAYRGVKIYTS